MSDVKSNESQKPLWNSLEIAKIIVGILTPIAIFMFTYQTNRTQSQAADAKAALVRKETHERERFIQVTKRRTELWSTISPKMNDLYCYFMYVGNWKEITPQQAVKTKRELDKIVYSNSPFFTSEFLTKYNTFMSATFQTGNGWGEDAKLKSPPIRKSDKGNEFMFYSQDGQYIDNTDIIHNSYFSWLQFAAHEMDLEVITPPKPQTPSGTEILEPMSNKL